MSVVALWTGALWGRPTWGTYWVWDARLTSTLILFFLYVGYMALAASFDDKKKGDRASALIALVGAINVPIIYFSVKWWNTLHQGSSVRPGSSSMATTMLTAMMIMTFAFWAYCIAAAMHRLRTEIIERERNAAWLKEAVKEAINDLGIMGAFWDMGGRGFFVWELTVHWRLPSSRNLLHSNALEPLHSRLCKKKMTSKQKRLTLILGGLGVIAAAVTLVLTAFNQNLVFFFTPSR